MAPHAWLTHYGAPGLFVMLVLGIFGLPIPDETLLSLAGFLLREGQLRPAATILAALLGSFCGITLSFALGETVGAFLLKFLGNRTHLTPERAERFRRIYARFGPWSLTFGYFVPGFRHFVAIAAGAAVHARSRPLPYSRIPERFCGSRRSSAPATGLVESGRVPSTCIGGC